MSMDVSVMSDGSAASGAESGSGSTQTLLTGLQALTRRLQDERDALQLTLDDTTRALQSEKSARATLENALQVRELELLHVTQTQQQASQQLRERVAQLERELDDERALHQAAVVGRTAALQKSAALAEEVRKVEVKWRKEMEKTELALAEIEILRDDALTIAHDRDQLVARTEADAKRVRELWQQIAREHESKLDTLRQELETTQRAHAGVEHVVAQRESQTRELQAAVAQLSEQNAALQQRIASDASAQQEAQRVRDSERDERVHALQLQLQQLQSDWQLATQREATATREQKLAQAVLSKCQRELDATTETLLALQSEFSELLDQFEQRTVTSTRAAREQVAQAQLRSKELARGKRCAEELAALRQKQLLRYKRVLAAVSHRLDDVHDTHESLEANAWSLHGDVGVTQTKSLCIYRH